MTGQNDPSKRQDKSSDIVAELDRWLTKDRHFLSHARLIERCRDEIVALRERNDVLYNESLRASVREARASERVVKVQGAYLAEAHNAGLERAAQQCAAFELVAEMGKDAVAASAAHECAAMIRALKDKPQ